MTPDDVIEEHFNSKIQLKVWELDQQTIAIEGSRKALVFLSKLIAAQAEADSSRCGFCVSPFGPGSNWFTDDSEKGLYIHRVPCGE